MARTRQHTHRSDTVRSKIAKAARTKALRQRKHRAIREG